MAPPATPLTLRRPLPQMNDGSRHESMPVPVSRQASALPAQGNRMKRNEENFQMLR
jgi:hypothetical protein